MAWLPGSFTLSLYPFLAVASQVFEQEKEKKRAIVLSDWAMLQSCPEIVMVVALNPSKLGTKDDNALPVHHW